MERNKNGVIIELTIIQRFEGALMRVFIGWSGDSSREVARCLNGWLKRVLQAVEPWFSDDAIAAGSPWLNEILTNLQRQDFFIACVTPESLSSGFFNFEIGIAAGTLFAQLDQERRICPVLYGIDEAEVPDPIHIFQAVTADEGGISKLVHSLNAKLEGAQLSETDLKATFEMWWPSLADGLGKIKADAAPPKRSQEEVLNEILSAVRQQSINAQSTSLELGELRRLLNVLEASSRPALTFTPKTTVSFDANAYKLYEEALKKPLTLTLREALKDYTPSAPRGASDNEAITEFEETSRVTAPEESSEK